MLPRLRMLAAVLSAVALVFVGLIVPAALPAAAATGEITVTLPDGLDPTSAAPAALLS